MPTTYGSLGENKGGDPNIMKLEATNKVRPLDDVVAEYRQHTIEDPNDSEKVTMVVCPGPRTCPLCRKPANPEGKSYFPMSRRFAACVWDYATNNVKVLIAGPQVFDQFKDAAKMGISPSTCDWTIVKEGVRINTKYTVVRHDAGPAPQVTPEDILDVTKYETPASVERIFEILEQYGIDYDALPIPEFDLDEALAFKMPYTTHKGLTIEKLLDIDPDFAGWLHGTKLEQGALGDPVFIALQVAMENRGMVKPLEAALAAAPEPRQPEPAQAQPPAAAAPAAETAPGAEADGLPEPGPNEIRMIANNGVPVNVPESSKDSLLAAGFTMPEPPAAVEPEAGLSDEHTPEEVIIGGQRVTLPRGEAVKLVAIGAAERIPEEEPAPAAEPEAAKPKIPFPDEEVQLDIGGTVVSMLFAQAEGLVASGSAKFVDEAVAQAVQAENDMKDRDSVAAQASAEQTNPAAVPKPGAAPTAADSDKPHVCPHCGKAYKTKGALTQHVNKEHAGSPEPAQAQPPAAAAPAAETPPAQQQVAPVAAAPATTGEPSDLLERVKDKIARSPFARDYQKIIEIFREETKKDTVMDMSLEELAKLDARIDKEIAEAGAAS